MATENPVPENGQTAVAEQPETQAEVVETPQVQEPKAFDPASLPPEAKQHFDKQYEGYEKFKGMAQEYERLLKAPEFQQWYQGIRAPQTQTKQEPKRFELSNEDFVAALSDPKKFSQTVYQLAEQIANEKFAPQIQQTQWEINLQKRTSEVERTMAAHSDFKELDSKGLIEPILMKYPTIGMEDAYWLAKRGTMNEEIDRRARGLVQQKKNASTEKPGTSAGARSNRVTAKTTLEAMEIAAEAFRQGREVPDIDIE